MARAPAESIQVHTRPEAELDAAARLRLERDRALSMSERLARVHELCLQLTSIGGAAKRP